MRRSAIILGIVCGLAAPFARGLHADDAPAAADSAAAETAAAADFRQRLEPLAAKFCLECHSGAEPMGELDLKGLFERLSVATDREPWDKIAQRLRAKEMPPDEAPQLSDDQRQQLLSWVDTGLARNNCGQERDPGRVTIRRLNRNEYNNTVRDLLGVDFHPADDFPSDDVGYGFDNIGDVLAMPPILLEKYLSAAQKITERALGTEQANLVTSEVTGGQIIDEGWHFLASPTEVRTKVRMFGSGHYIVRAQAYGEPAGDEPPKLEFYLDTQLVRTVEVHATKDRPQTYEAWITTKGGQHSVSVVYKNDFYNADASPPQDRNVAVRELELMGPYPATYQQLIPREHTPEDQKLLAREIVAGFMQRAFRRPVAAAEVDRMMRLTELAESEGEPLGGQIALAMQAVLVSPHFLFRVELDPAASDPGGVRTLNDYELASRLSYFLWSTMPDAELFELARLNKLHEPAELDGQVKRMLADAKSQALVENFAGQWLQLRNLKIAAPDKQVYPDFDEALREAMQTETELFFAAIMREDRSVLDFIDADFTFVNERLARHYGLPDVKGKEFRRVSLDGNHRGGVLAQASVLTVTSNPTRTSPVKRGKWVLDNLLGTPPPPPPADVPPLEEAGVMLTGALRERMEQHRAKPVCASCHKSMDPLGFGLENYDGIGSWREADGKFPIDPSGTLPSGQTFASPRELKAILKERRDEFVRCLAERMLTYGLGRGVEYSDRCTVDDIAKAVAQNEHKFSSLILAVVHSDAFQKRSGKGSKP